MQNSFFKNGVLDLDAIVYIKWGWHFFYCYLLTNELNCSVTNIKRCCKVSVKHLEVLCHIMYCNSFAVVTPPNLLFLGVVVVYDPCQQSWEKCQLKIYMFIYYTILKFLWLFLCMLLKRFRTSSIYFIGQVFFFFFL